MTTMMKKKQKKEMKKKQKKKMKKKKKGNMYIISSLMIEYLCQSIIIPNFGS